MEEKKLTGYPSIDKPWLKYYSEEAINAPLPECTMYEYLWNGNKMHLTDTAIEYFGTKITYKKCLKILTQQQQHLRVLVCDLAVSFPLWLLICQR